MTYGIVHVNSVASRVRALPRTFAPMTYRDPPPPPVLVVAIGKHLVGMDPRDGRHLWDRVFDHGSQPRVWALEDRVYVLGVRLVCLELGTGKTLWESEAHGDTLLVANGLVIVATPGQVFGVDPISGGVAWHDELPGKGWSSVALALPGAAAQVDRSS